MKPATLKQIKEGLANRSSNELLQICLLLIKSRKENKELATYLLFEQENEERYVSEIKKKMDKDFAAINTSSFFYMRKSAARILRELKKYIRFSKKPETEIALLIYFCIKVRGLKPSIYKNTTLKNSYNRQLALVWKKMGSLHEDLQYDYSQELKNLPFI